MPSSVSRWCLFAAAVLVLLLGAWPPLAAAQCGELNVTYCPSATAAARALAGDSPYLTVGNATWAGACNMGTWNNIGLAVIYTFGSCHALGSWTKGAVVLSTGNATAAAATNNAVEEYGGAASNATWFLGYDDTHLRAACIAVGAETPMAGQALYDMSILEFDLTPALSGPLVWTYVFGSDEYPAYAPGGSKYNPVSPFNDIFGLFIWPKANASAFVNVAIIPNTTNTPVSISTVHKNSNAAFYRDNSWTGGSTPFATEFNGLTTELTTQPYQVTAGVTYRLKLALADGADWSFDSAVWLKSASLVFSYSPPPPPPPSPPPSPPPTPPPPPGKIQLVISSGQLAVAGLGISLNNGSLVAPSSTSSSSGNSQGTGIRAVSSLPPRQVLMNGTLRFTSLGSAGVRVGPGTFT